MTDEPYRILVVEDNPADVRLLHELLRETPTCFRFFVTQHVSYLEEAKEALSGDSFDLVLLDLNLPDSTSLNTLVAVREISDRMPIVVLTGIDDEDLSLELLHAGAQDYILKGTQDGRALRASLRHAIERQRLLDERDSLFAQLKDANQAVNTLHGLIPVCMCCKKIRTDKGYWEQLEVYLESHSDAIVSHGLCGDCLKDQFPEQERALSARAPTDGVSSAPHDSSHVLPVHPSRMIAPRSASPPTGSELRHRSSQVTFE